jgi:hypothetical protein
MKTKTITVAVHKNKVELKSGETIHQFVHDLGGKAREHIYKHLNLPDEGAGAYVGEIFGDYVVMEVWEQGEEDKYYAFTYERNSENGLYQFGEPIEVERKTIFVQVSNAPVEKNLCGDWVQKSLWSGVL